MSDLLKRVEYLEAALRAAGIGGCEKEKWFRAGTGLYFWLKASDCGGIDLSIKQPSGRDGECYVAVDELEKFFATIAKIKEIVS